MYKLASHPLLAKHSDEITAEVERFKRTAAMNLLLPLLHLDSARSDITRFINSHLKEVCVREESKVLIEALTECLTYLQSQTWRLVRRYKLSNPKVATRVMIALLGTQPLVVNYHSGVLVGIVGRLGLTPPGMTEFTHSPSEGMLSRFMKDLEHSIKADDSGKSMAWSIQGGLHTEYSSDFMQRNRGEIHCVFRNNLLPNLIKDLDALHLSESASPLWPRGRLDHEQLIEQFKEMRVEGRKTLFSTLVDCVKGFLTAEDRDQMANLIRPDPAPLPPVMSTATPVMTTIGDTPLNAVPQPPVTTTPASLTMTTIAAVVTTVITPVTTTTPAVAMTTAITPVTSAATIDVMPQGGTVSSAQQITTPVGEAVGAIATVAVSEVPAIPQVPGSIAFPGIPSIPGTFPSASWSQPAVETFTTLSGSTRPVSHPIIIQPSDQRPPPRIVMGVEGLTLPSDPTATVTVTVARLVDPLVSCTSLQGLASHQAASATSHQGVSTAPTVIGTIHGPGVPRHIAMVGGSVEPVVSTSTSCEGESNIFMVVEDDDEIVEVGTAQGFTKIMEPKKETVDLPHASRGRGMAGGASRGRPPRGGGKGPAVIHPIMVDDLGANDDDDNLPGNLLKGGEEELIFDDPNKGEEEEDKDDEEEEDEDEVQVLTRSGKSTSEGLVPFNPEIHDITGYEKVDMIKL